MKKNILVFLVVALFFAALWYAGSFASSGPKSFSPSGSFLKTDEPFYDFGEISMAKGKARHIFKVKNSSEEPLKIGSIYTSCMCTEATLILDGKNYGPYGMPGHGLAPRVGQTMTPNEEAEVLVEFDPAAHGPAGVGFVRREVIIETADGAALSLSFAVTVTP